MYFIILYNRTIGKTEMILSEADHKIAFKLFEDKTVEYRDSADIEVNYITADDEADLKKCGGRFFNCE